MIILNYHKILANQLKITLVSLDKLVILFCEDKFICVMFILPDAPHVSSNRIRLSHENVEMTLVKTGPEQFYSARKTDNMANNNSIQNKFAYESKIYILEIYKK